MASKEYSEDDWKKVVASITMQANAQEDGPITLEMYIDRRDDIIMNSGGAHRTLSDIKDIKLQADIQLAIYYFKAHEYAKMVSKCRAMAEEYPVQMLQHYNLL